ncbi:MAG: hypothetical protein KF789_15175, partial [Bdellovibrionaceae bacterium]|nr:hypothetical protein [Pseudobdellovibrionaceae bacterium]
MFGNKSVILFSLILSQTLTPVAQAGPWKQSWGSLFQTGTPAVSATQGGTIETTVFAPVVEAITSKRFPLTIEVVDSLPAGQDSLIEPDFPDDRLNFRIKVTKQLAEKPALLAVRLLPLLSLAGGYHKSIELMVDPNQAVARDKIASIFMAKGGTTLVTEYGLMELVYNMEAGSPSAKERWMQRQALWLSSLTAPKVLTEALAKFTEMDQTVLEKEIARLQAEELAKVNADLPRLEKEAKSFRARQEKLWDDWKKETQAFEKLEARELKLNDLIVRNDRRGVRRLIETYLPWPLMEPAEAHTWKNWLDAVESPRADKTTVAFRGVDYKTDFIQRLETPEGTKIGFMSTLLTKNQGSYTRRLRSLSTRRVENADDDSNALR